MKQLLAFALIAFSVSAHADVVKPTNTIEDAVGAVSIGGDQFDYRVSDRGEQLSANIETGKAYIVAQKIFLLSYSGKSTQDVSATDAALNQDGRAKCQELGEIELAEKAKAYPNHSILLKTKFMSDRFEGSSNGEIAGVTYSCLVTIEIGK